MSTPGKYVEYTEVRKDENGKQASDTISEICFVWPDCGDLNSKPRVQMPKNFCTGNISVRKRPRGDLVSFSCSVMASRGDL